MSVLTGERMANYAIGYRQAAELLAKHVLDTGFDHDFLVYPTMFLYRQYVELRLKEIAVCGARLEDLPPPDGKLMGSHDLAPLWAYDREVLERIESGPSSDLDDAERTLNQLRWADKGSYAFRFATDKHGNRSLPADLQHVDFERVFDVMSGVGNLLDGIVEFIQVQQDAKHEMEREYGPY